MAHGFLQALDKTLQVFSAGIQASGQLNQQAVAVMSEVGIPIGHHTSDQVDTYLNDEWDFVITVCGQAQETCPAFAGKVRHKLHFGFDDPSHAKGSEEYIWSEFRRVRNEIGEKMQWFYEEYIRSIR